MKTRMAKEKDKRAPGRPRMPRSFKDLTPANILTRARFFRKWS